MRHKTMVLTDESLVPPGWVRMRDLAAGVDADKWRLSAMHRRGAIRAVKVARSLDEARTNGAIWIHPDDAAAFLAIKAGETAMAKADEPATAPEVEPVAGDAVQVSAIGDIAADISALRAAFAALVGEVSQLRAAIELSWEGVAR